MAVEEASRIILILTISSGATASMDARNTVDYINGSIAAPVRRVEGPRRVIDALPEGSPLLVIFKPGTFP